MAATPVKINTGRRKEAVARVRLVPGAGDFTSTAGRSTSTSRRGCTGWSPRRPLRLVGREKDYDVIASIRGGGIAARPARSVWASPAR